MPNRNIVSIIVYIIIGLAVFGLIVQLITQPMQLFRQLLLLAVFLGIILFVFRLLFQKRLGSESSAFRKAVKQSKAKYSNGPQSNTIPWPKQAQQVKQKNKLTKPARPLRHKRKDVPHLTVIEGKKGKKKNRALF